MENEGRLAEEKAAEGEGGGEDARADGSEGAERAYTEATQQPYDAEQYDNPDIIGDEEGPGAVGLTGFEDYQANQYDQPTEQTEQDVSGTNEQDAAGAGGDFSQYDFTQGDPFTESTGMAVEDQTGTGDQDTGGYDFTGEGATDDWDTGEQDFSQPDDSGWDTGTSPDVLDE